MRCGEWSERDELARGGGAAGDEECQCGECPWSRSVEQSAVGYRIFGGAVTVAAHKMTSED